MRLAEKECAPCKGGIPPLRGAELKHYLDQVEGWGLVDEHHITKSYTFDSFKEAMDFANKVAELAEQQSHHPVFHINFKKVTLDLYTHKIGGLAEADFVFAAKVDAL